MLRVLLASGLPPPEYGGIINWSRVVRRELGKRSDVELAFVDTTRPHQDARRLQTAGRLVFGSYQAILVVCRMCYRMWADRPDVVHLNTSARLGTFRDILILRFAKWLGIPSVIHLHMQQPPAEMSHRSLHWKMLRWALSLASVVVVLDKRSESCVRAALPHQKIAILPTMVEMDVIDNLLAHANASPASDAAARLVFVGFVCVVKGVRELLQACLKLTNRRIQLDVIGKVDNHVLHRELELLAAQAGKTNWLRFHGPVNHSEVLRRILAADMLVLPSHAESAPAVVLEAMGCGKPVVSTFTGAIPDMLDIDGPEQCGLCALPRDVDALAAAIARLLDDPEERELLGRRGRNRVEQRYAVPVGCSQLLELWRSLSRTATPLSQTPSDVRAAD